MNFGKKERAKIGKRLSKNIRFLRESKGLSKSALGEKIIDEGPGNKNALSFSVRLLHIENKRQMPHSYTLIKLSKALEVKIDDLVWKDLYKDKALIEKAKEGRKKIKLKNRLSRGKNAQKARKVMENKKVKRVSRKRV